MKQRKRIKAFSAKIEATIKYKRKASYSCVRILCVDGWFCNHLFFCLYHSWMWINFFYSVFFFNIKICPNVYNVVVCNALMMVYRWECYIVSLKVCLVFGLTMFCYVWTFFFSNAFYRIGMVMNTGYGWMDMGIVWIFRFILSTRCICYNVLAKRL